VEYHILYETFSMTVFWTL